MTHDNLSPLDAFSVLFQPGTDWHNLWDRPARVQVAFILEQAKTEQEQELARGLCG